MAVVAAHYLKLEREDFPIDGESEGLEHEGQIDVKGWDWDVSDKSAAPTASKNLANGRAAAGQTKASADGTAEVGIDPSLFTFTKPVDSATTALMKAMDRGDVLKRATFELVEEMVEVKNPFRLLVVLEKVTVVSYKLGGRAAEHRVDLDETWGLNYTTISFNYMSAGGLNASFKRNPGSTKREARKPVPDIHQVLKENATLRQDAAAKASGAKDKRG